jgi:hypothetical protein
MTRQDSAWWISTFVTRARGPFIPVLILCRAFWTGHLSAAVTVADSGEVVWKGTKAYEHRVDRFKIKPTRAFDLAWQVHERVKQPLLYHEPEFIAGRWYWFGKAVRTQFPLTGYYVNGETGAVEYRRSLRSIKSGVKQLPADAWYRR